MVDKKLNITFCTMFNRYKAPSRPDEEIPIETIRNLHVNFLKKVIGTM